MADKKLYSVLIEHNYLTDGKEQKKLVEVAVGFGNAKGGLSVNCPRQLNDQARVVIFPISPKDAK